MQYKSKKSVKVNQGVWLKSMKLLETLSKSILVYQSELKYMKKWLMSAELCEKDWPYLGWVGKNCPPSEYHERTENWL